MANLNNYAISHILDSITGNTAFVAPTQLILCLLQAPAAKTDTVAGNADKELFTPGLNGYQRQVVTFDPESGGISLNAAGIVFGPAVSVDWPEATDAWLIDNADNVWFQGPLTTPKQADISDTVEIIEDELSLLLG